MCCGGAPNSGSALARPDAVTLPTGSPHACPLPRLTSILARTRRAGQARPKWGTGAATRRSATTSLRQPFELPDAPLRSIHADRARARDRRGRRRWPRAGPRLRPRLPGHAGHDRAADAAPVGGGRGRPGADRGAHLRRLHDRRPGASPRAVRQIGAQPLLMRWLWGVLNRDGVAVGRQRAGGYVAVSLGLSQTLVTKLKQTHRGLGPRAALRPAPAISSHLRHLGADRPTAGGISRPSRSFLFLRAKVNAWPSWPWPCQAPPCTNGH